MSDEPNEAPSGGNTTEEPADASGEIDLHTQTELVSLDTLTPYAENPKNHPQGQIDRIAESIRRYGMDQAIVIDAEGVIIKGHGRYEAAQQLGLTRVPVRWRNGLSPSEVHGARIADNKTNLDSGFDYDLLAATFSEMQDSGLSQEEIADMAAFDTPDVDELINRDHADINDFVTHPDRDITPTAGDNNDSGGNEDGGSAPDPESAEGFANSFTNNDGTPGGVSPPPGDFECPECGHTFTPSPQDMGPQEEEDDDEDGEGGGDV